MHPFKYAISIRIVSFNLDPDDICHQLGMHPKWMWKMGEPRVTPNGELDVEQLRRIMGSLTPEQEAIANKAIEKFGSKAADWISKNCKGDINRKFPTQFREKTAKEIMDLSRAGDKDAKTAWKLLNKNEYQK